MIRIALSFVALAFSAAPLTAQSFNLDFGQPGTGPSSSYAAAGLAGYWNALVADGTSVNLKDLAGNTTGVTFWQAGAAGIVTESDPSLSGDDALLMNDGLICYTSSLDSCFYFNGLQPGIYELITYAWRPNHPTLMAKTFVDNTPGVELSGGAWPGQQQYLVTYARHIVTVTSNGFMGPHSGLSVGGDTSLGGVCNGIQLRPIDQHASFCWGDGSANPCPCGNFGPAGRGCTNSFGGAGKVLASGGASVASDTLLLSANGMGPSVTSIFLQGSDPNNGGLGTALADGLLCVGGTLKRLGVKVCVGGASSYPQGADAPISVKGAIPASGGTFHYQTYYRDPAAYCTSGTYNLTNGVHVVWVP